MKQKPEPQTLYVEDIPIAVYKKDIKHIYLSVRAVTGRVRVSAPWSVTDETIIRYVQAKSGWLQKHLAGAGSNPCPAECTDLDSGILYVWGKPYSLHTVFGRTYALALDDGCTILTVPRGSAAARRERFVCEWQRAQLKTAVTRLLPIWEQMTGLRAQSWQTKQMKTRWGTCNTKTGKLWFSLQLAEKPPECLEYVILHELIHLTERKHNHRFYTLLDRYMPHWREVKKMLNRHTFAYAGKPSE